MSDLVTVEDLARMFGHDTTYYVDRNKSRWPHVKVGGKTLFTPEQVDRIVALHTIDPDAPTDTAGLSGARVTRGRRPH